MRQIHRLPVLAAACCLALAAASLAIAHEPVYDAWAWLVWGRELAGFELDTSSGPSWKPLPVALTTLLSLAGDAAPALWLVLVRAAWLFSLVLAWRLAHQLTAGLAPRLRIVAGAFAALTLLLLADDVTMWARQGAAGMSEPLLVALVLGAVAAALDGRDRTAFALGALAALLRPEVWPLLGAYGLWLWPARPALRATIAALAITVAALWIVPGLLVGGDAASAGERARRGTGTPLGAGAEALGRALLMALALAWPLAAAAVVRTRDRALLALATGALAWIAIVAAMAVAGFPGLPRYMAPALAIVAVLAGVGLAHVLTAAPSSRGLRVLALALLALTLAQLPGRAAELPHAMSVTARIARSHDRLSELTQSVDREQLLRCGKLATSDVLVRTALAWELDVELSRVVSFGAPPSASGAFVIGPQSSPLVRAFMLGHAELLGRRGEWSVYSLACPPAAAASASSTGVSGARW